MAQKHFKVNTGAIYLGKYTMLQKHNGFWTSFHVDFYKQCCICYANMLLTSDTYPYMWKTDQWAITDAIKWVSQINKLH